MATITVSSGTSSAFTSALNNTDYLVVNGGTLDVENSGTIIDQLTVASGGRVDVSSGGEILRALVATGGLELVESGGSASATTVEAGGNAVVLSNGTATDTTLSGGTLTVSSGGTATAILDFSTTGGEVIVAAGGSLSEATISGFTLGDSIDLQGLGFTAGVTSTSYDVNAAGTGGTLTIANGADTMSVAVLGQYQAANFTIQSDGKGGTLVEDPPVKSSPPPLDGVNYVADVYGSYADANSLASLKPEAVNSVALTADFGIDAENSTVYQNDIPGGYTESDANIGTTIKDAVSDGLSVMVRPLIDFLPSNYETAPGQTNSLNGAYSADQWRSDYNPSNVTAFFSSYQTMIVDQAQLAQADGATIFSIGTELDQITGPAYETYWDNIITAVRAVFTGALTYSADWDDAISPWQYGGTGLAVGTGDITTQVSFWNKLDYVGIDEYAPISDLKNPTLNQLIAGWTQAPTDSVTSAVTGGQSLINYYEGIAAATGKPLLFTEIGYANSSDAASSPATPGYDENGNPDNATADPTLQANLYQAYFDAWQQDGNGSLAGAYLWDWEPGGAGISPFSVQGLPAQSVVETGFTDNATCYGRGTLILTDRGEIPIEHLAIGDKVFTMSGTARPIKWIGRRSYSGRFLMGQKGILPICFSAGSLGDNVPRRDLWISPHHAMYLEGVLIEARHLVNGVSVVQAETVEKIEYFHIELDSHDVVIAEGSFSETFIDDDSRGIFHNAHEYCETYGDAPSAPARYCAPRSADGYDVEAARAKIEQRAGLRTVTADHKLALRGRVDDVQRHVISGWAQNPDHPEAPVCLDIYADGQLIGQTLANRCRADLQRAGLGSGRHGFHFTPPSGWDLASYRVEVRRSLDGAMLEGARYVAQTPALVVVA
jgi:autotransporter passenger strand-loop-strand repeat protein